jgi:2-polyprenyl-3-methyl-5-hydroxy-6-metoxy-1,4-benzoquinol methylase
MAKTSIDPKEFWNKKILTWESERYEKAVPDSLMERLAKRFGGVNRRLENAQSILTSAAPGNKFVEFGCGSGVLAETLIEAGAASYHGIDIADIAIEQAQERVKAKGLDDRITFETGDEKTLLKIQANIVFSLGVLDWLTIDQVKDVFSASQGGDFLHSYSERQASLWVIIHKAYCFLKYAHETRNYAIRYDSEEEIRSFAEPFTDKTLQFLRDSKMRFGVFVTTLSL